ncbi:hypothetical protein OHB26_28250 [Nocardia sp. NBC_01503]|uniref:tautomerase family protein n=1 Tax=Nocardia sp. NBC_01503 TaxID=2975997 RepID=UPI002E7BBB6C|nr:hypothetical protein [Nocardia sp. NBC_01503]WTL30799.1 hypothetical protein OHB26_28250 [Nocardia sp. NBC_01503]
MPFVRITIADPDIAPDTQAALAADITGLLEKDLFKEPEVTVVHLNLVPADRWFVGATRPAQATGAHLEVSITLGTNTSQEKAAFIEHAYDVLNTHLGTLPGAAYVALYELDGEGYGYNGVTQLARRRMDPTEKD